MKWISVSRQPLSRGEYCTWGFLQWVCFEGSSRVLSRCILRIKVALFKSGERWVWKEKHTEISFQSSGSSLVTDSLCCWRCLFDCFPELLWCFSAAFSCHASLSKGDFTPPSSLFCWHHSMCSIEFSVTTSTCTSASWFLLLFPNLLQFQLFIGFSFMNNV